MDRTEASGESIMSQLIYELDTHLTKAIVKQHESQTNTRHGRPVKIDQLLIPVVQEVLNNAQERTEAELAPPPETTT